MQVCTASHRVRMMVAAAFVTSTLVTSVANAAEDGYVFYLSEYLTGDYYYASLDGVDTDNPPLIQPTQLRLPGRFRARVELGNADVSFYDRTIVFAARKTSDYDWDIYRGTVDLKRNSIRGIYRFIGTAGGGRDEDPRFSWDGSQVVYKCDGNICIRSNAVIDNPVVESECELWAPSFDLSGYSISYTKRCDGATSDRIWTYNLLTGVETEVPNTGGGADRFAHYLEDGRIVYSHIDTVAGTSSLWTHEYGSASLLHNRTASDDDAYPDKHNFNHIAFIGWEGNGYNLFMYRLMSEDSVRLSIGVPILSPVLFR